MPAPGTASAASLPIGDGDFVAVGAEGAPLRLRVSDGEVSLLAPGEVAKGEIPDYENPPFLYVDAGALQVTGSYPLWTLTQPRGDGGAPFAGVLLSLAPGQAWISARPSTGFVPLVPVVPVPASLKVAWHHASAYIGLHSFHGQSPETQDEVALSLGAAGPDEDWHVFLGDPGSIKHIAARIVNGRLWWLAPGQIPTPYASEGVSARPFTRPAHALRLLDPRGGRRLWLQLGDREAKVSSDDKRQVARYEMETSDFVLSLALAKPDAAAEPGGVALPARATLILGGPGAGLWDRDAKPATVWPLVEPLPEIPAALSGRWQITRLPHQADTAASAPRTLECSSQGVWIESASGARRPAEWVVSPARSGPHLIADGQLWRILRAPDDAWVAVDPLSGSPRFLLSRKAWQPSAQAGLARFVAELCDADALAKRIAAHPAEHAFDPRALLGQLATDFAVAHGPLRFTADRLLAALEVAPADALGEVFGQSAVELGMPAMACPALGRLGKSEAAKGGPRLSAPGEEAVAWAAWQRLGATGESYQALLASLLAVRPHLARPLARAFLRLGEYRCSAERTSEECGSYSAEEVPGTVRDEARFGDPCLNRAWAAWALADARLREADVATLVDELVGIIGVAQSEDSLREAALGLIGEMHDKVRLPILREVAETLSDQDLHGLSEASLRSLYSDTGMDAALLALDPGKHRGFVLKAMRSEDMPLAEASLLELLDRVRAWTGGDVEAALRHVAGKGPCEASMKAALILAERGDERFLPQPRKPSQDETQGDAYRALCRISRDPDPDRQLARYLEFLPPRGRVRIDESGEGHESDESVSFARAEVEDWNLPGAVFAKDCWQEQCEVEVTVEFSKGKDGFWYLSEIRITHPYTTC